MLFGVAPWSIPRFPQAQPPSIRMRGGIQTLQ